MGVYIIFSDGRWFAAVVQREDTLEDGGGAFDDVTGKLVASLDDCLLE